MKRMKRIGSIVFAAVLGLSLATAVWAEEGNVSYEGGAEKFVFTPGNDLFPEMKGVMPGDSISQDITVKNSIGTGQDVNLYLKSHGAQKETGEFLSKLKLTVKEKGKGTLFEAPANETAQLTEWVHLGKLKDGGEAELTVTLEVPIELGNEIAGAKGIIDWEFKAEELPLPTPDPTPTPTPTGSPVNPKTGDTQKPLLFGAIAVAAAGGVAALLISFRKKKEK